MSFIIATTCITPCHQVCFLAQPTAYVNCLWSSRKLTVKSLWCSRCGKKSFSLYSRNDLFWIPWFDSLPNLEWLHRLSYGRPDRLIKTDAVYTILLRSNLPREVLGYIWDMCNRATPGQLTREELFLILAMISVAQVPLNTSWSFFCLLLRSDILVKELILVLVSFSSINYSFYSNSVLTLFFVLVYIQLYRNNFTYSFNNSFSKIVVFIQF